MRLHETLSRLTESVKLAVGDNLIALILGGGYGRGEGGIIHRNGVECCYNDLDLMLIVENKRAIKPDSINKISRYYQAELGIHIDFSRPMTLEEVRHWPNWLMWQDLLNGHIVLDGPDDILTSNAPAELNNPLPLIEASRLLLNRGAGLLWAMRVVRGVEPETDEDFARRNFYKCQLALGDAMLIAYGNYVASYRARGRHFACLATEHKEVSDFKIEPLYSTALLFKFFPDEISSAQPNLKQLSELASIWGSVFLHIERMRTGKTFFSLDEYVRWKGLREPEQNTTDRLLRNLIRNLQNGNFSLRYPREKLFRTLPPLLALTKAQSSQWEKDGARFLNIWRRFN
jgi:hypothetical protein